MPLKSVLLVEDRRIAELVARDVLPYHGEFVLVAADGSYPREPGLWEEAVAALRTRAGVRVAVIGAGALRRVPVASPALFVLDELLSYDLRRASYLREVFSLDLNGARMAGLLRAYFGQGKFAHMTVAGAGQAYAENRDFDASPESWSAGVLLDRSEAR